MTDDPWDDPETKAYLRRAKRELEPMIKQSAVVMALWTGQVDPKMAIEMGYSILLGKPIVALKKSGMDLPPTFARIVDRIVEFDELSDPGLGERIAQAHAEIVKERGLSRPSP